MADSVETLKAYTTGDIHTPVIAAIRRLKPHLDTSILDLGCGSGALLYRLSEEYGYTQTIGADIDLPGCVHKLNKFIRCDMDEPSLPLAEHSVGLIVATEVIEHVMNISAFLKEIKRVLSPGGYVILTTPNVHSVEARLRYLLTSRLRQFDFRGDPTHVTPVFLDPFRKILRWHGLKISDYSGIPENGRSVSTRRALRVLSSLLRGLGVKGYPDGDSLMLILSHRDDYPFSSVDEKVRILKEHYC